MVVGLIGFVLSVAVHVMALLSVPLPEAVFALHVGVFVAFGPVVFAMIRSAQASGLDMQDFRQQRAFHRELFGAIPVWQRAALYAAFAYFFCHFAYFFVGFFLGWIAEDTPPFTFFSAVWIVAYLGSMVFARRLLLPPDTAQATRAA
jgi:hypothetical protein